MPSSVSAPPAHDAVSIPPLVEVAASGQTALYRLYDASDGIIYIGISDDPDARMKQHADDKPWWPEVARISVVWYQARLAAENAETIEIGISQPKYNKAKRYVRLPEQALGAPPLAPRRKAPRPVRAATVAIPAQAAGTSSAGPDGEEDDDWSHGSMERRCRWRTEWLSEREPDTDVPRSWPGDMWSRRWWNDRSAFEDMMEAMFCPRSDGLRPYRATIERVAEDALGGASRRPTAWVAQVNPESLPGNARYAHPWAAHSVTEGQLGSYAQELQRRFLYALVTAGRCTTVTLGSRCCAAGFAGHEEAQAAGVVLADVAGGRIFGLRSVELATAAVRAAMPGTDRFACPSCGRAGMDDVNRAPRCPECRQEMLLLIDWWEPWRPGMANRSRFWEFPPGAPVAERAKVRLESFAWPDYLYGHFKLNRVTSRRLG